MAASLLEKRKRINHRRWISVVNDTRVYSQRANASSFAGFRIALGWWHCDSNIVTGKILYGPPMRQMLMIQIPLWGKIIGVPLSRKVNGKVEADWNRKCPAIKWTTDAYGLAKPEVTFDSAIPDEQGISINSTQDEISAAIQRGKPSIQ